MSGFGDARGVPMNAPIKTVRDRYSGERIAGFYAAGYWQPASFNALVAEQAARRGDQVFVFDSTTSLTYAGFRDKALRLAVGLRREGLRPGDRVAVQLPNWTEFPVIAAALSRIGAILVPIMPIYREDEVAYVLRHSGAVAAGTWRPWRRRPAPTHRPMTASSSCTPRARPPGPRDASTPSTPIARARTRSSRAWHTPSRTCSSGPRLYPTQRAWLPA